MLLRYKIDHITESDNCLPYYWFKCSGFFGGQNFLNICRKALVLLLKHQTLSHCLSQLWPAKTCKLYEPVGNCASVLVPGRWDRFLLLYLPACTLSLGLWMDRLTFTLLDCQNIDLILCFHTRMIELCCCYWFTECKTMDHSTVRRKTRSQIREILVLPWLIVIQRHLTPSDTGALLLEGAL